MSGDDNLDVFERIARKYFAELEQSVPHMQQTLFDLQNEYYKMWKGCVTSQISLQRDALGMSGLGYPAMWGMLEGMADEAARFRMALHRMAVAGIEQGIDYAKALNDNAEAMADANKRIAKTWFASRP